LSPTDVRRMTFPDFVACLCAVSAKYGSVKDASDAPDEKKYFAALLALRESQ